jgi:prepilin peptidase CpaA
VCPGGEGEIETLRAIENVLLVAFVLTVMWTDFRWRRIPNAATFPAMGAGLVLGALEGIPGDVLVGGLLSHVAGLLVALAISYPLYASGGLKAGDGKLLMAVGALRGVQFLLSAALIGALVGGLLGLVYVAAGRLRPAGGGPAPALRQLMKVWIPYGVALGLGALIALALEAARL